MAKIIIKNTNTIGVEPSSLSLGELAINVADGTLFFGDGHTVKKMAVSRSVNITGTVTSVGFTEGISDYFLPDIMVSLQEPKEQTENIMI